MNINYFDFNSRINLKKGYLLVAQPFLIDSYFNRSVILICDHNKNGTIGLQVNKPLKSNLKSIISKTLIYQKPFLGGPKMYCEPANCYCFDKGESNLSLY